jgi:hypothetical protein
MICGCEQVQRRRGVRATATREVPCSAVRLAILKLEYAGALLFDPWLRAVSSVLLCRSNTDRRKVRKVVVLLDR